MRITTKVLFVSLLGLVLAAGGLVLVQVLQTGPYLDSMERLIALDKSRQVERILEDEWNQLATDVKDWAFWDPAYDFVAGINPSFVEDNLIPESFETLGIDTMVFFQSDGTLFWGKTLNTSNGELEAVTADLDFRNLLKTLRGQALTGRVAGYWPTPKGWSLVAFSQIKAISRDVPPGGFLLFTKLMGPSYWNRVSQKSGVELTPSALPARSSRSPYVQTEKTVRDGVTSTTIAIGSPNILGYVSMEVRAEIPRVLEHAGLRASVLTMFANIGVLTLLIVFLTLWIRHLMIHPLRSLAALTETVKRTSDYSLRATIASHDEMGALATGVNELIEAVGAQTTRLELLASTDALTGLSNRRTFDLALETVWKICRREKYPVGLIMGDVDFFKKFNDLYGHRGGDACLRAVAGAIQDAAQRPSDVKARYGGEEFALILPNTTEEGTRKVALSLAQGVRDLGVPHAQNPQGKVTISLGLACLVPTADNTPAQLVETADAELYKAKAAGRDRISPDGTY